ncbi:MAG: hypothetical protein M3Z30_13820, partial [Gemmatimonadota bacterium]|nr:hypothetical protein [Gemmatimonadota bacterium]
MMISEIAGHFPFSGGENIFLNSASVGPHPTRTAAALEYWLELRKQPWKIGLHEQFGELAKARRLCAQLIGADPEEIALVPNTSTGLNVAAQILEVAPDKLILGYDGEFP